MNKTKKWFGLGVTLLSASILVACGNSSSKSDDTSKEAKTEKKASTEKSSEKKSTYAIGDKIVFDKQAEYTITNVEWTDERNDFDKTNPDKVLKVTYNVKNLSDSDLAVGVDIDLFVGGNKMETYPNTIRTGNKTICCI